jgi:hypothetical protein
MLGAHVQTTKNVEDNDEEHLMLENRTQVQYFLDYCICGLKLILQDLSPERVSEAVSVRVRTTPKEAVERIREGMVSQPRIIEDLLRNVRKSIMILASHPPSPPSPKRMYSYFFCRFFVFCSLIFLVCISFSHHNHNSNRLHGIMKNIHACIKIKQPTYSCNSNQFSFLKFI